VEKVLYKNSLYQQAKKEPQATHESWHWPGYNLEQFLQDFPVIFPWQKSGKRESEPK
jgi:hypothetical protein